MATRSTPTERQKRLGAELRKLRIAAGTSTDQAAALLGLDRTKISNMESGTRLTSPARVRALTDAYGVTDRDYVDALVAMAEKPERGWWEEYRGRVLTGLLDIAETEWYAARLQTVQSLHLPGLLHTEEYARSVFAAVLPPLPRLDVELRVSHRMNRQRILGDDIARPYVGYIHEAALRMQFGGRAVTRKQLDYVAAMSEKPHITIRVIPVEQGSFPGAGHALLYAEGPVPQLDTVQLDSAHGPVFTHTEDDLAMYRAQLAWMDEFSLPAKESRDFIRSIARQL